MRRHKLISEIYAHALKVNANKSTLVFILAAMTDKSLTKFHKEFLTTTKYKNEKKVRPLPNT